MRAWRTWYATSGSVVVLMVSIVSSVNLESSRGPDDMVRLESGRRERIKKGFASLASAVSSASRGPIATNPSVNIAELTVNIWVIYP